MSHTMRLDEPSVVYVEDPREQAPSDAELMDANERLAKLLSETDRRAWELAAAILQAETLEDAKQLASSYLGLTDAN
jgi:hypothetical protein